MLISFLTFALALVVPVVWPGVDLWASGLFYRAGAGFPLADQSLFVAVHGLAVDGSRVLAVGLAVVGVVGIFRGHMFRKDGFVPPLPNPPRRGGWNFLSVAMPSCKACLFLLLTLVIGPGLVANAGFKDHWGRARPHQVIEFGGHEKFSPALVPQPDAKPNGSFVCGDGSFGFFLPAFAFVVPRRRARRVFWVGMGVGAVFGFDRLAMGAHFFSDIVYGAFFMLLTVSALHAVMYGRQETVARWRGFFRGRQGSPLANPIPNPSHRGKGIRPLSRREGR
jgi:lipid A 4'-phosphatase